MPAGITVSSVISVSGIGRRPRMEDALYKGSGNPEDSLFFVCDGVGGHPGGQIAARTVVETLPAWFRDQAPGQLTSETTEAMHASLKQALYEAEISRPHFEGMSTTLAGSRVHPEGLEIFWIGDSRVYLLRGGEVVFRTRDHNFQEEMKAKGADSLRRFSMGNVLVRVLSARFRPVEIETAWLGEMEGNERLLICTDGVLEALNEAEISALSDPGMDLESAGKRLEMKCREKASDNYSAILVDLSFTFPAE